jgi:hypothetical protein
MDTNVSEAPEVPEAATPLSLDERLAKESPTTRKNFEAITAKHPGCEFKPLLFGMARHGTGFASYLKHLNETNPAFAAACANGTRNTITVTISNALNHNKSFGGTGAGVAHILLKAIADDLGMEPSAVVPSRLGGKRKKASVDLPNIGNGKDEGAETPALDAKEPDAPKPDAPKPDAPDAPDPVPPEPDAPKPDGVNASDADETAADGDGNDTAEFDTRAGLGSNGTSHQRPKPTGGALPVLPREVTTKDGKTYRLVLDGKVPTTVKDALAILKTEHPHCLVSSLRDFLAKDFCRHGARRGWGEIIQDLPDLGGGMDRMKIMSDLDHILRCGKGKLNDEALVLNVIGTLTGLPPILLKAEYDCGMMLKAERGPTEPDEPLQRRRAPARGTAGTPQDGP